MFFLTPRCDWNFEIALGNQKIKICKSFHMGVGKLWNDERIPKYLVLEFNSDNIWRPFWEKLKNWQNTRFRHFWHFCRKGGQILFDLNPEIRFGFLSSLQNFLTSICKDLHISNFWTVIVILKFQPHWGWESKGTFLEIILYHVDQGEKKNAPE